MHLALVFHKRLWITKRGIWKTTSNTLNLWLSSKIYVNLLLKLSWLEYVRNSMTDDMMTREATISTNLKRNPLPKNTSCIIMQTLILNNIICDNQEVELKRFSLETGLHKVVGKNKNWPWTRYYWPTQQQIQRKSWLKIPNSSSPITVY